MNYNQQLLFDLLLEVDEICRRHDIEYFLEYGTILGAIRHDGFIPWDADIDISMSEDNYNRFVEACESDLDHTTRTLCDNRRNREYPVVYGRYINLETCRMDSHSAFWENICGQSIDVFCNLELPGDPKLEQEAIARFYAYDEFVNRGFRHFRYKSKEIMSLYRQYEERAQEIGREALLQELEAQIFNQHYSDCKNYIVSSARYGDGGSVFPKSAYENMLDAQFEGHTFKIPAGYCELLTLYYGESFNLFPKDIKLYSAASKHLIPCEVYVRDLLSAFGDAKEISNVRKASKEMSVEEGWRYSCLSREYFQCFGFKVAHKLHDVIQTNNIDVKQLVKAETKDSFKILSDLFAQYIHDQTDAGPISWQVHFDIGDDLEYAALLTLARTGRRDLARQILFLRKQNELPLTEEMLNLEEEMSHFLSLRSSYLHKDYASMNQEIEWCENNLGQSDELLVWKRLYACATAHDRDSWCDALIDLDLLDDKLRSLDSVKKARGDMLFSLGCTKNAATLYSELLRNSNDGLLLNDIKKKEDELGLTFEGLAN